MAKEASPHGRARRVDVVRCASGPVVTGGACFRATAAERGAVVAADSHWRSTSSTLSADTLMPSIPSPGLADARAEGRLPARLSWLSIGDARGRRMTTGEAFDTAVERYHRAAGEFVKGNCEPYKALFSHGEDVTVANPFFPVTRGWENV